MSELEQAKGQILANAADVSKVTSCIRRVLVCHQVTMTTYIVFIQVGQDKMNELTETQVKLSLATQEISSLKAALQTSNRQREQVMACYRDY